MDIKKILTTFEDNSNKLNIILRGFENSPYYCNNISINNLFKDLVNIFIEIDKSVLSNKDYLNVLSGGLRTCINKKNKQTNKKDDKNNKIITFSGDLKIILNNLIGLIGYEFATSLITIMGFPKLIQNNISAIKEAKTYKDIGKILTTIINIYKIQNCSVFKTKEPLEKIFNPLYELINDRIKKEQNTSFKNDKESIIRSLKSLYKNTTYDTIYIKTIDNLCINLEKIKPCYDGYFIKIWELLFKETYADYYEYDNVYPKFNENTNKLIIPYMEIIQDYIKSISNNNANICMSLTKYTSQLNSYFNKIYRDISSCVNKNDKNVLNVSITDQFYEHLSSIAINLIIVLAKNIVISQSYLKNVINATRLQFIQIFNGVRCCVPTLMTYNESQLYVLHYIMLTNHVLIQSNNILNAKEDDK